jgi:hypothetical protein
MSKWLQEKQMTAFEVTYQGKTKTLQEWSKGVSLRDRARLGPDERINFRDVVNIVSGLALGQRFVDISPEYPTFSVLVTEANRKQLVGNALRALAGGTRTKDARAILDALELLDGDRVDPANSRYAQEVLNRLKAKGHGQVLNRSELLSGTSDVEYFAPIKYRLEPDLLVTVLGGLVYSGDIVLSITGDKIDSGKLCSWQNARWKSSSSSSTSRHPRRSTSRCCVPCSSCSTCRPAWPRKPARATPSRSSNCRRKSARWCRVCSRPAPTCSKASSASGARTCCAKKKPKTGTPGWIR